MHHNIQLETYGRCLCECHVGLDNCECGWLKIFPRLLEKEEKPLADWLMRCRKCGEIKPKGSPCLICTKTLTKPWTKWGQDVRAVTSRHTQHLNRPSVNWIYKRRHSDD